MSGETLMEESEQMNHLTYFSSIILLYTPINMMQYLKTELLSFVFNIPPRRSPSVLHQKIPNIFMPLTKLPHRLFSLVQNVQVELRCRSSSSQLVL